MRVRRRWVTARDPDAALVERLRAELRDAAAAGRGVAVGGARHSMGGQSLAAGGTAVEFTAHRIEIDRRIRAYRVPAGARWAQVIPQLDPLGLSPKVMQSNNDFSVGGTASVNAHGWAVPHPPMGGTIREMRVMLADGTLLTCSRETEPELFAAVVGGYGLAGVILDLTLTTHPNLLLSPARALMPAARLGPAFAAAVSPANNGVHMAYGRLSVARRDFLQEAVLTRFVDSGRVLPGEGGGNPAWTAELTRRVYRGQRGSEAWKRARWFAETRLAPLADDIVSRNTLLDTPVAALAERDRRRVDILHEYFLPPDRLETFLAACRRIIPGAGPELLNVTVRWVEADRDSLLAYAPGPRVAAVMSFSQARTPEAEAPMRRMTERLVDAAIAAGGSFYLPYRLHARRDQVERAYPGLATFVAAKRRYDPKALFRNALWDAYFA